MALPYLSYLNFSGEVVNDQTLTGQGFTVALPYGFNVLWHEPLSGSYWLLPPGSSHYDIPAIIQIRPVKPQDLPFLLQNLYQLHANPYVAMANAANLGLSNILSIAPVRSIQMYQGTANIRELDAITIRGFPARVMVIILQGTITTVEVVIMMNLYRWVEFIQSCLVFVSAISLSNQPPIPSQIQAVIDPLYPNNIEYQLINPDQTTTPFTKLPAVVYNNCVVNINHSIKVGDVNGTGIIIGHHSIAEVNS
jgi:hypothetical protein